MSKPNPKRIATSGNSPLTHNPFGSLDALGSLPPAPEPEPACAQDQKPAKLGRVVLRKETAHRGGKSVIVVDDFAPHLSEDFIENLAKVLRKSCGCGGAVKDRRIELQGDQPEKIRALLQAEGFRVAGIA